MALKIQRAVVSKSKRIPDRTPRLSLQASKAWSQPLSRIGLPYWALWDGEAWPEARDLSEHLSEIRRRERLVSAYTRDVHVPGQHGYAARFWSHYHMSRLNAYQSLEPFWRMLNDMQVLVNLLRSSKRFQEIEIVHAMVKTLFEYTWRLRELDYIKEILAVEHQIPLFFKYYVRKHQLSISERAFEQQSRRKFLRLRLKSEGRFDYSSRLHDRPKIRTTLTRSALHAFVAVDGLCGVTRRIAVRMRDITTSLKHLDSWYSQLKQALTRNGRRSKALAIQLLGRKLEREDKELQFLNLELAALRFFRLGLMEPVGGDSSQDIILGSRQEIELGKKIARTFMIRVTSHKRASESMVAEVSQRAMEQSLSKKRHGSHSSARNIVDVSTSKGGKTRPLSTAENSIKNKAREEPSNPIHRPSTKPIKKRNMKDPASMKSAKSKPVFRKKAWTATKGVKLERGQSGNITLVGG